MRRLLLALGLFLDSGLSVHAWPQVTYKTEELPSPGFKIKTYENPRPGNLFFGIIGNGYLPPGPFITKDTGELVWRGPQISTHDVKVQSLDNEPVLTYWTGYGDSFGHGYGSIKILDNTYSTLHSVCLTEELTTPNPTAFPGNRTNPCYFDSHENYLTDRGTVVATAYNVTQMDLTAFGGPRNGWIFDALFYEVDIATNEVVFRWSALEHIPLHTSNYFGNDSTNPLLIGKSLKGQTRSLPWDFFHINSVQVVDGGYLVNSRMTWAFYMIDGSDGSVKWTLEGSKGGDFTLDQGIFWSWQHMPRLLSQEGDTMKISLFNNDNINALNYGFNQTTGYLLSVDTSSSFVSAILDLKDDRRPIYSGAEGSYQALGRGHVLMGYGSAAAIKEFDAQGNVIYDARIAPLTNQDPDKDKGKDVHSYRTYRFPWHAQPSYPPKVAAIGFGKLKRTRVYMSWNGATTHNVWNIYAGEDQGNLRLVASNIPKNGFETEYVLRGRVHTHRFVRVEAMKGTESLGTSDVIETTPHTP